MAVRRHPRLGANIVGNLGYDLGAKIVATNVRDVPLLFFHAFDVYQDLFGGRPCPHKNEPLASVV